MADLNIGIGSSVDTSAMDTTAAMLDKINGLLDDLGDEAKQAGRASDDMGDQLDQAAESAERLAEAVDDVGDQAGDAAEAADRLDEQLSQAAAAADQLAEQARQAARETDDLGDEMGQTATQAGLLDAAIAKSRGEYRRLIEEFDATGNTELLPKIRKESGTSSALRRLAKELEDAKREAADAAAEVEAAAKAADDLEEQAGQAAGAEERLGDEAAKAAAKVGMLDAAIEASKTRYRSLLKEFDATGNVELLPQISKESSSTASLQKLRKELDAIQDEAAGVGKSVGAALMDGIEAAKGGLVKAGPIVAAVIAPAIGATIAGAVLASIGAAGLGAGVAAAIKDERVKAAGNELVADLKREVAEIGQAFAGPTIDGIGRIRAELRSLDLSRMLAPLADAVGPMVDGIDMMLDKMGPGLSRAIAASEPVLEAIAGELPVLGAAFGSLFDSLADSSGGASEAFTTLIDDIAIIVVGTGYLIEGLSTVFEWSQKLQDIGKGFPLVDMMVKLMDVSGGTESKLAPLKGATDATAQSMSGLANATNDGANAMRTISEQIDSLNKVNWDAREAESALQAAIDGATESARQHGRTLDLTTDAGRKNDAALYQLSQTAEQLAQATYDQTYAQYGNEAAVLAASAAYDRGRDAFIAAARQMGMTKQAAQDLADRMLRKPPDWNLKATMDVSEALAAVERVRRAVNTVKVNASNVSGRDIGDAFSSAYAQQYYDQRRAGGGPVIAGVPYIIGEQGRETFIPDQAGYILDAGTTATLMSGGAGRAASAAMLGGAVINLNVYALDPRGAADTVMGALTEWTRGNGPIPAKMVER